jgi:site-specific DNA-methyltransferase (adenine-specific)
VDIDKILHGDCLELLQTIPNKSIDMILCDLPYGVTACKWDSVIPLDKLWAQYKRIAKDNAAMVFTTKQPFTTALINSNIQQLKYCMIWKKNVATGFANCNVKPMAIYEDICVFGNGKGALIYNPQMQPGKPYKRKRKPVNDFGECYSNVTKRTDTINEGTRYPTDIIEVNREVGLHPTQKPVALFEYLIKTYTHEGAVVLDNCAGSCTTAVAALNCKRHFICMEKEQKYVDIGSKRISGIKIPEASIEPELTDVASETVSVPEQPSWALQAASGVHHSW